MKKESFNEKYGTLTEDFFVKRTLYQKAYYPIFVFQRLLITAILVMMYDSPWLQIVLLFFIQIVVSTIVLNDF